MEHQIEQLGSNRIREQVLFTAQSTTTTQHPTQNHSWKYTGMGKGHSISSRKNNGTEQWSGMEEETC